MMTFLMNSKSTKTNEIVCDIELVYPYEMARHTIHSLALIKNIRIIQSFMNATVVRVGIPIELFQQWYGTSPVKGLYPAPSGADSFINSVLVRKIIDNA